VTDPYGGRDPMNPWTRCACGHLWMSHDIEEYTGDGSETCCVVGCDQVGCPGRSAPSAGDEP